MCEKCILKECPYFAGWTPQEISALNDGVTDPDLMFQGNEGTCSLDIENKRIKEGDNCVSPSDKRTK